jgi:hypothetical protein
LNRRGQSQKLLKKIIGLKPGLSIRLIAPPLRAGQLKTKHLPGFSPKTNGYKNLHYRILFHSFVSFKYSDTIFNPFDNLKIHFEKVMNTFDNKKKPFDKTKNSFDKTTNPFDMTKNPFDKTKNQFDKTKNHYDITKKSFDIRKKPFDMRKKPFNMRKKPFDIILTKLTIFPTILIDNLNH